MRFEKPKGQRIHKQFIHISSLEKLWWVPSEKRWVQNYLDCPDWNGASTAFGCRSLKAFKRHLKYHPEIKGKAVLVSRFVGYNVYG